MRICKIQPLFSESLGISRNFKENRPESLKISLQKRNFETFPSILTKIVKVLKNTWMNKSISLSLFLKSSSQDIWIEFEWKIWRDTKEKMKTYSISFKRIVWRQKKMWSSLTVKTRLKMTDLRKDPILIRKVKKSSRNLMTEIKVLSIHKCMMSQNGIFSFSNKDPTT